MGAGQAGIRRSVIEKNAKGMPRAPPNHAVRTDGLPLQGSYWLSDLWSGALSGFHGGRMSAQKLIAMNLAELADAYASRSLSPVEVVKEVISHAESVNGSINALFCFRHEQAIASAAQSEARWKAKAALGPLDGVPMTVKDSVAMIGWPYF